jgi:hypothetical protein
MGNDVHQHDNGDVFGEEEGHDIQYKTLSWQVGCYEYCPLCL